MKKLRFFSMLCLLALIIGFFAGCKKDENGTNNGNNGGSGSGGNGGGATQAEFVDLGLPSGTKWNSINETTNSTNGYYTFDEAVSIFGDKLPTKEQCEELMEKCTWEWQSNGSYKVTGTNGNSIVLPAAGGLDCDGYVSNVGTVGYYRSSTPYNEDYAWYISFYSDDKFIWNDSRCFGLSVRLVQD